MKPLFTMVNRTKCFLNINQDHDSRSTIIKNTYACEFGVSETGLIVIKEVIKN